MAGLVAALSAVFALPSVAAAAPKFKVLVFAKTAGFRHDSIETVFAASYTDAGPEGDGEGALTGNAEITLTPTD